MHTPVPPKRTKRTSGWSPVHRAIHLLTGTQVNLGSDLGLSGSAIRAWQHKRRYPSTRSRIRLMRLLQKRGEEMMQLAQEIAEEIRDL